jgi:hypothetical protein
MITIIIWEPAGSHCGDLLCVKGLQVGALQHSAQLAEWFFQSPANSFGWSQGISAAVALADTNQRSGCAVLSTFSEVAAVGRWCPSANNQQSWREIEWSCDPPAFNFECQADFFSPHDCSSLQMQFTLCDWSGLQVWLTPRCLRAKFT